MSAGTEGDLEITGIDEVELLDETRSPVYSARQIILSRRVAIKVLNPHNDPLLPRRFDRRRKAIANFTRSADVVPLYDSGETVEGKPYIVMPYFRIGSLQDQINHGKMPWHMAVRIIHKTAEALSTAHDNEITLGDIKPSSILLSDPDTPRISVYGMATRRFDDGGASFTAPEVGKLLDAGPTSDVYSLAMTLGALVTGEVPTRSTNLDDFLSKVHEEVPEETFEVIEHGTASNVSNRYGTARHLARALDKASSAQDPTTNLKTRSPGFPSNKPPSDDAEDKEAKKPETLEDERLLVPENEEVEASTTKEAAAKQGGESTDRPVTSRTKTPVNSPKAAENPDDKLVHLREELNPRAANLVGTKAKAYASSQGDVPPSDGSQVSPDNEGSEKLSATSIKGMGSKITISDESVEGLRSHRPASSTNASRAADDFFKPTEEVDITALRPPEDSDPNQPQNHSEQFRQTQFLDSADIKSARPQTKPQQEDWSPGSYESMRRRRPSETRLQTHNEPEGLWLSLQDSFQSNRHWLTAALLSAVLLIVLVIAFALRGGGTNSGNDLPPLTPDVTQSSTPEPEAPVAVQPPTSEETTTTTAAPRRKRPAATTTTTAPPPATTTTQAPAATTTTAETTTPVTEPEESIPPGTAVTP